MKIIIEVEPEELATLALELQMQPEAKQFDINVVNEVWEKTMQSYVDRLNRRNPKISV